MDQLAERLGIDLNNLSALLARDLATGDLEMTLELVTLRKARGITVEHVAEQLGRTPEQIREFERLEEDPRLPAVRQYALVVGARIDHHVSDTLREDPGDTRGNSQRSDAAHMGQEKPQRAL